MSAVETKDGPIYLSGDDDSEMQEAEQTARKTFRYFWREVSWEGRRIVPAMDQCAVKFAFEGPVKRGLFSRLFGKDQGSEVRVEHMWLGKPTFDGEMVSGVLLNSPQWIRGFRSGDRVSRPLAELEDWLYAMDGKAFGGFTIDVVRGRLSPEERTGHDRAWGLEFGEPGSISLVPQDDKDAEHAFSDAMSEKLGEELEGNPGPFLALDGEGWSMLHKMALAGSLAGVQVLIKHGADASIRTKEGRTALDLANLMGWPAVSKFLGE